MKVITLRLSIRNTIWFRVRCEANWEKMMKNIHLLVRCVGSPSKQHKKLITNEFTLQNVTNQMKRRKKHYSLENDEHEKCLNNCCFDRDFEYTVSRNICWPAWMAQCVILTQIYSSSCFSSYYLYTFFPLHSMSADLIHFLPITASLNGVDTCCICNGSLHRYD